MRRLVLAVALLAACGNEIYDGTSDADGRTRVDAGADCTAEAMVTQGVTAGPGAVVVRQERPDRLGTELKWTWVVAGEGPNPDVYTFYLSDPAPLGTPLELVDACTDGAAHCWTLESDVIDAGGGAYVATQLFYPDKGTVTIHEAGESGTGRLTATFSGSKFFHYVGSDDTGHMPAADYWVCTTTLPPTLNVDLPIEPTGEKRFSADRSEHVRSRIPSH